MSGPSKKAPLITIDPLSKKPDLQGALAILRGQDPETLVRERKVSELEPHPLALLFPAYEEEELAKLACDIRDHGLIEPITLFEDKILDGVNRVQASKRCGLVTIPVLFFSGNTAQAQIHVISKNLIRRHLDTGQRAMIAAELAKMQRGRPSKEKGQNCPLSVEDAAVQLKVSPRTVKTAKAIKKTDPALADEVKQGRTKLSNAAKIIAKRLPSPSPDTKALLNEAKKCRGATLKSNGMTTG